MKDSRDEGMKLIYCSLLFSFMVIFFNEWWSDYADQGEQQKWHWSGSVHPANVQQ